MLELLRGSTSSMVAGGVATWFAQGKYRKAARQNRAEAERLRNEAQTARPIGEARVVPNVSLQHHA